MTNKSKRGGAREGAGRKTQDGVVTMRYQVGLDAATVAAATALSAKIYPAKKPDVSFAIREAFRILKKSLDTN